MSYSPLFYYATDLFAPTPVMHRVVQLEFEYIDIDNTLHFDTLKLIFHTVLH